MNKKETSGICVVGAGIVGLCCAHYLQKSGFQVTLIDKGDPGRSCSYGNAGILTATECGPIGLPGMMRSLPKWLINPFGPISVKPSHLPNLLPWGLRLLKESKTSRVEQIADLMQSFYSSSVDMYSELLTSIGAADLIRKDGYVCVYRDRSSASSDEYFWDLHRRRNIELQELGTTDIRQLVPEISRQISYGIYIPQEGRVLNPYRVSQVILKNFMDNGGTFIKDSVQRITTKNNLVTVSVNNKDRDFSDVVIAAGIESKEIVQKLGYKLLLESMRGYHAMIADPKIDLELPVMSGDYKFFGSPMEHGLRLAGTAEFASYQTTPNYKRSDALVRAARLLFPHINIDSYDRWMGNRPMTPDSLPVIGEAPRHKGIYFAFGHGHNGLSGAPMTGSIITDILSGRSPAIDIQPLSIERFQ